MGPKLSARERRQAMAAQLERNLEQARDLPLVQPGVHDLINAARLLMRYPSSEEHQFGSECRAIVLNRVAQWGMDLPDLFNKTRELWHQGYRPEQIHAGYGSGADLEESNG